MMEIVVKQEGKGWRETSSDIITAAASRTVIVWFQSVN